MPSDHPVHNDREDSRVYRSLVHIVVDGQWMWTFDVQAWGTLCEDEASHDGNDPGLALRFFHLSAFSELHYRTTVRIIFSNRSILNLVNIFYQQNYNPSNRIYF